MGIELKKFSEKAAEINDNSKMMVVEQLERALDEIEKADQELKAYTGKNEVILQDYFNRVRLANRELAGMRLMLTCIGYDIKGLPGEEDSNAR